MKLEEGEKAALVWEIHEKAIELYVRRWRFRIGLALAIVVVFVAIAGWQVGPWIQQQARLALDDRIEEMTELERDTIKRIKLEQAIAFQSVVSQIEDTKKTTEATLKSAKLMSEKIELESANVGKVQQKALELVSAIDVLQARRGDLPILAEALEKMDNGKINFEKRLQKLEARQVRTGTIHLSRTNHNTPRDIADTSICEQSNTVRGQFTKEIGFEKPFDNLPKVIMGLSGFEFNHTNSDHLRLFISVKKDSIIKTGFKYDFYTWCRTDMRDAYGWWIAHSQ